MMAQRYFPGSNTCRGFVGYFQDLLPRTEQARILLIKGGPGCGKSTLMRAAAEQIDHAIFDFQIIVVNGQRYFAFVKLNVNWWDPCTLYEYEGGELCELCQWDNMRLLSIGFI